MKKMNKLTIMQKKFVQEYMFAKSATEAAIKAGYAEKDAGKQAYALLKKKI